MRTIAAILFTLLFIFPASLAAQPPTYRGRSVAQWSDDLSHPNSVVRLEAGKMLARLGNHATEAVDPLIAALRDRNPDVRLHAATALGRIQEQPEKCLAALLPLRKDQDEHVRFAAEWSLARFATDIAQSQHTTEAATTLDALLADVEISLAQSARDPKHLEQVSAARLALKNPTNHLAETPIAETPIAETHPRAEEPQPQTLSADDETIRLLADLQTDDPLTQLKAIDRLGRLGRAAELVEAWRTAGEYGFLRWHLMRAVIKIGEPALPVLTQALRDDDEELAAEAARCLSQMEPRAIGAIGQLLDVIEDRHVTDDVRESAIRVIGDFGPAAKDAVGTLTQVLTMNDHELLVETCARALGAIGPEARPAEPALLAILRSEDQPDATRLAAAEALPAISPNSAEVVATLIGLLDQDRDPFVAAALADALGKYGEAAAPAVPRLIELVDLTSDFERQLIVQSLGNIGPAAHRATPRLIECLTEVEEFETTQATAARTLAKLGPEAVISLASQLEHPHHRVRQTIARAMIEIGERAEPAIKPLELRLLDQDEAPEIQALVTVSLGQIGPAAQSTLPTLTRLMGDVRQAVYVRAMAAVSIGQIDPEHSPTLIAALNNPHAEIRVAAAYALQRLPTPHPDAMPTLMRELEHDAGRDMSMRALSEFKEVSRPFLTEVANDRSKDEETRVASLTLISENGVEATEQLLEALNDETLAESAYWSLRDLGNDSIPFLIAAADDEEQFTGDAQEAIRELLQDLYGGIGGAGGDESWSGGHALVDRFNGASRSSAAPMHAASPRMAPPREPRMAKPRISDPRTSAAPMTEPRMAESAAATEPDSAMGEAEYIELPPPIVPETGYKSVKVFYGTNRKPLDDGPRNGARLPWFAWLLIVSIMGGMLVFAIKQFRRRATGRGIVGVAGIVLFSLGVEAAVTRMERLDEELAKAGPTYGTEYSTEISMGVCDVTIPDIHRKGQVERPSIIRLQVVEDPERHIILKTVQQLDRDAFYSDLQSELGQRGDSILVFVHGFNVSFESAARRTAQMSHDLKLAGAPVFYSWPSQANWRKYRVDEKNVELSVNQLKTFLLDITQHSGADTINLIAHSMGNRALTNALKEIEVASSQHDKLFNQVILAAPDIDADVFRERIAPAIVPKARHITLYASSNDLALVASREFHSGDPRAGDAGADLVVVPGIDTIDVSAGQGSLLGHSYYGDSTSVLHDIKLLLRGQPAADRQFLQPYPRLEPTHWLFQPTEVARHGDASDWR